MNNRNKKSQQGKREKYHKNTFFRLEEENALQFVNAEDILEMADIAIKNLNHE